jgi:1-aminocyclopropane-1-carboxylate deaminase/D-cysteine desulfhydrase-like pyridoxal-dependent ACC family enzyme
MGLRCILVLSGSPADVPNGNLLLDNLFGAEIVWTSYEERQAALQRSFDLAWEEGRRPYLIPLGASNALGAVAYAAAFEEFQAQAVQADWIVIASSSGGTQAGLALGARLADWQGHVLGISIDEPEADLKETVAYLASEAGGRIGPALRIRPDEIRVDANYLGQGYGVMGEAEIEAIRLFARHEGLLLDPVYTARAAAGLIGLIRSGFFTSSETVLFWHTGGTPALFAEPYVRDLAKK